MKRLIPVLTAIVLIIIILAASMGTKLFERYTYSSEKADLRAYYGLTQDNQAAIVMGNEILEEKAQVKDGEYYLPYDIVSKYFVESRFYVNKAENSIRYCLPDRMIQTQIGEAAYQDGSDQVAVKYGVSYYDGDTLYLAVDFIRLFKAFDAAAYTDPNRIEINLSYTEQQSATLKKDSQLRVKGGVKSEILEDLTKGASVTILETMDKWTKVKSADAMIGYVKNGVLNAPTSATPQLQDAASTYGDAQYTSISKDYQINMAWHQVSGVAGNATLDSMLSAAKGVNTISPTWFFLSDNAGNITSYASQDYVTDAHNRGLEVWAKLDDFTAKVDDEAIFSSSQNRQNLITALMNEVQKYGIDGINIDCEKVSEDAGPHFVEFIRELSISCRAAGIVLSVDNYPPSGGTTWYNRAEQSVFADYVIVMGYDENYSGGGKVGSVASINYVENGIKDTLKVVPSSKLINALPFYTRIWKTTGTEITSEAASMSDAQAFLTKNGLTAKWDDTTCQNYAELQDGDTLYQVWLEDAASLQTKLNVMKNYNLAGVAEWKLGLETPDVWDEIAAYSGTSG